MTERAIEWLRERQIPYHENTDTATLSSLRAGAVTPLTVTPRSEQEAMATLRYAGRKGIPAYILGALTNTLVVTPYPGILLCTSGLRRVAWLPDSLQVGAGVRFAPLCQRLAARGYRLLPALSGIPGTVGGMLTQNAGAYGAQISDALIEVTVYDREGDGILTLGADSLCFGYRRSVLQSGRYLLLRARLRMERAAPQALQEELADYRRRRRLTQPVGYPSLGSYFKRPPHDSAARLIDAAGLRGLRCGGAAVSEQHAGFLLNIGGATVIDVLTLAREVRERVLAHAGVSLQEEVTLLDGREGLPCPSA